MKLLLISLLLLSDSSCTTIVYVCNSPNATKYHYRQDCRGLSNCHFQVIKTTLEEAQKGNKTLCSWEKQRNTNR